MKLDVFATRSAQGYNIHCYFDNNHAGYAVHNASRLKSTPAL
jgi:uncharacterized protein YecE (DUF72 family)